MNYNTLFRGINYQQDPKKKKESKEHTKESTNKQTL